MRILHLGDIHLGKKLNEYSLLEEQKYLLEEIYKCIENEKIETVVIAGDIYDRSIPPEEAVKLFDDFITTLSEKNIKVVAVTGNHDSGIRLNFAHNILSKKGVHIYGELTSTPKVVEIDDVDFYLIPFATPAGMRKALKDKVSEEDLNSINSFDSGMRYITALIEEEIEKREENKKEKEESNENNEKKFRFGIYHGFVGGSSEDIAVEDSVRNISIGGKERVSSDYFNIFNYTALGHLHSCRSAGSQSIMYSGSPLKYSFSEVNHTKYFLVIDTKNSYTKEDLLPGEELIEIAGDKKYCIKKIKINEKTKMVAFTGTIEELLNCSNIPKNALLKVVLTSETTEAMNKIRSHYPNVLEITFNIKRDNVQYVESERDVKSMSKLDLLNDFISYTGYSLNDKTKEVAKKIMEKVESENLEN